ncbi:MAG: hypothetical protein ABUL44_03940, partial [Flavobacterium sp.]
KMNAMAEKKSKLAVIKTKPTAASVEGYINTIEPEQKRIDSFVLRNDEESHRRRASIMEQLNHRLWYEKI